MTADWPLVGRRAELEAIAAALGTPRGLGAGVVLAGVAGIGKTRLAREALVRLESGCTVRWVVATHSSQPLPLGVLAPLVGETGGDQVGMITRVGAALAAAPAGGAAVIGIDDAHLLDAVSATVVHHVVLSGAAPVVLTLRSGEAAPDAITTLWKDGYLPRIDLQPLSEPETTELLEAVLGGPLDSRSAHRLWELSRGVTLYLRHLIDQQQSVDRLRAVDGVWRWYGDRPDLSPTLTSLIESQMGVLPGPVRRVVDLLAVAEPLSPDLLASLVGRQAVERAETCGLIVVETIGNDALAVRLTHPLYGEVRMAHTGQPRARRLRGQVATALAQTSDIRGEYTLHRAMLTLDSDLPSDPALFAAGAQIACLLSDLQTCERLARAALDAGGGSFSTRLVWTYALSWLGHCHDAERELALLETEARDDTERVTVATGRAYNLFWGLGHTAEAEAALDRAGATVGDAGRAALTAIRAAFSAGQGRPEAAVTYARTALAHNTLAGPSVALASFGLVGGLGSLGHADQIAQAADRGYAAAVGAVDEAFLRLGLGCFHFTGLAAAGYLHHAERVVEEQNARTRGVLGPAHVFGLTLTGSLAIHRGHLRTGIRVLNEVRAGLDGVRIMGFDYFCLLGLARVHAMVGDVDSARQRLAELDAVTHPGFSYLDIEAILDRAWLKAAEGVTAAAIAGARDAAVLAATRHQWIYQVVALQMAVRFGDAGCAERLAELAEIVDGPRVPAAAAHARALAAADGPGLDDVSYACEAMGDLTAAADAAAHAAAAYQRRGLRGSALAAAARARRLTEQTGACTPALAALAGLDYKLSTRQREIAALIGQGLTNQQIAERLVMSVRTVEGHIYRAGTTLGLSREQLADLADSS